ncbi:SusC/RagA family TonB-linked outer membrane protein [Galbibacter sp. PAP.153]|uniref:SusC/RagA family TonB-linked outer membrane protein n=1 Tax=Galbibacter sp. PAP.153 TaxID=3104623 RepID=UPI003009689E
MKNYNNALGHWYALILNFDLKMKLTLILFFIALFQINAESGYAQNEKVTLHLKSATIPEIIQAIESNTDYKFFFSEDELDSTRRMDVSVKKEKLTMVLDMIFEGTVMTYKIIDKQIVLTKRKSTPQSEKNTNHNPQQHRVRGTVLDSEGIPIPFVNVLIKSSKTGVYTNENGLFELACAPTDVLLFTNVGYNTEEFPVQGRTEITITLKASVTDLGAVTVNAGYYTVSEKERTGSISKITAADIEEQPVTNVLATMQGRMPGVFVTQDSGVPGDGFSIQVRGQNSLRSDGNAPLYIIDGVPYASQSVGANVTIDPFVSPVSPLNNIDPTSIASIEVLKDADATSIYGSRGANGVILITTKRGSAGKTRFQLGYSYGTGRVANFMDLMDTNTYLEMRREAYANDGAASYPSNAYDVNGTWDQARYTDWQKVFIGGTAAYTDVNGSVSGGSQNTQFNVGGNYHRETTVYPDDNAYHKLGVHSSLSHSAADDRFKLQLTTSYTVQDNKLPGLSFVSNIYELAPNAPALYDDDGSLNWEDSSWTNPLSDLETYYNSHSYDLISNLVLSYELFPGLTVKSSFGYNHMQFEDMRVLPYTRYNPAYNLSSKYSTLYKNKTRRESWIVEPQLTFDHQFGDLSIQILLGATFQNQTSSQLVQGGSGFSSEAFVENLSAAETQTIYTDDHTQYKYNAFFGRLNFSFRDRYILNLTGRRDGSSRFGPGKQFANFWAIGGAWLFSEWAWIKEGLEALSFGKLRGSYGITGSDQIGDYQYLDTYSLTGNTYGGTVVMEPSRLFNPLFSWEENKKLELALELGFFKDRLFLTASRYRNRSSNQLVGIPLPGTTGFASIQANLDAVVENKGWEFQLRSENFNKSAFFWSTSFNLSLNKNELISFPELEGSTYANRYVIGKPLNIKKVYKYEGIDQRTGLYQFKDFNNDGQLSINEDRMAIKDINPDFYGGFQNTFRYKGFSLDILFQFVKQENYKANHPMGLPGLMRNQLVSAGDRWQMPGDQATYQPYSSGANSEIYTHFLNYYNSDGMIDDASFVRLKNVTVSYRVPKEFLSGVECTIELKGQNIFTFTGFDGLDPETVYANRLPPLRVLTTGVKLNF